jgi:hypothetical protein
MLMDSCRPTASTGGIKLVLVRREECGDRAQELIADLSKNYP